MRLWATPLCFVLIYMHIIICNFHAYRIVYTNAHCMLAHHNARAFLLNADCVLKVHPTVDLLRNVLCRVSDSELDCDPAANLLTSASEEAQKVARNEGKVILP